MIKMSVKGLANTIFRINKKMMMSVTLQVKLHVLKRFDAGEHTSEIASMFSLPDFTVRTIKINKKNCKTALNVTSSCARRIPKCRNKVMENTEKLLGFWIDQVQHNVLVSLMMIQEKVMS
jgi:hypothetical protein